MVNRIDMIYGLTGSIAYKAPVKVATTENITLAGEQTIDGVSVTVTEGSPYDRVLVKDQDDQIENGIYDVKEGAWSRSPDFDGKRDAVEGTQVRVNDGTDPFVRGWYLSTPGNVTIGTDALTFVATDIELYDLTAGVSGTANQVVVTDDGDGTITLSTPQDTDTDADVEFDSATLDDLTASRLLSADANKKVVSVSDLTAWIAGTTNQATVTDDGDGTVTLSLPQSIDTAADVEFGTVETDKLILDIAAGITPSEGEITWNADDGTANVGLPGGVVGQMFQELFFDGKNKTGSDIPDGTPIMFSAPIGVSGKVEIQPAIADGSINSELIMGMTSEQIINGEFGKVTWFGKVRGIDTTGTPHGETWAIGDLIYVGLTSGSLTNVEPNAPYQRILIASVLVKHAVNGVLLLRPTWNSTLKQLDDVNGTPLTVDGQILVWDNVNEYFDFDYNIKDYKVLDTYYAEMYEYENTTATSIGTQNVYHAISLFQTGILSGFTFVLGSSGSGTITDYSGTVAGAVLMTDTAHGLLTGCIVTQHNSTDYNGTFEITKVDDNSYYIIDTYTSNQTTDWAMGSYLLCSAGSDGVYRASMNNTAFGSNPNEVFKFELNINLTPADNVASSRKFAGVGDFGSMGSSGLITLSEGDRVWMSVRNETSGSDVTVRHSNVNLVRC